MKNGKDSGKLSDSVIERLIYEIGELTKEQVGDARAKVSDAGYNAPQSYVDEMNGFARGISAMGNQVICFLQKKKQAE